MESNNMAHLGVDVLISNMMIHSLSPQGRRLVEQMYTCDPFDIDIRLDSESKNRSAEIVNTYLKTVGRKLVFEKRPKKIDKIVISPLSFDHEPFIKPISFLPESMREGFDYVKDFEERQKFAEEVANNPKAKSPIKYMGSRKKV
jgi:hypothetical protein